MNFNKIFDKLQPKVLFVLHFFFFFLNSFFSFPSSPLPFSQRVGQFTMHLHYKNSCNLIMNSRQWFTLVHWKILCLCIFSVQPSCILLNLPAFYWTLSWRILLSLKKLMTYWFHWTTSVRWQETMLSYGSYLFSSSFFFN